MFSKELLNKAIDSNLSLIKAQNEIVRVHKSNSYLTEELAKAREKIRCNNKFRYIAHQLGISQEKVQEEFSTWMFIRLQAARNEQLLKQRQL